MSWNEIPQELKALPQWVGALENKRPIDPKTGGAASVTNPETWGTFEQACRSNAPYIGFVFTANDPYVFIDLDTGKHPECVELHTSIVQHCDSYTETSKSGKGSHIIVKSNFKGGVRDDNFGVEVYGSNRYMLATGWQYTGSGIVEADDFVQQLVQKISNTRVSDKKALTSEPATLTDEQLLLEIAAGGNGDKFKDLLMGEWQRYPEYANDHSRADAGLLTILDFYTKNVEQVVRIFKKSALYRPNKGRSNTDGTDYILRTLEYARACNEHNAAITVDIEELTKRAKVVQETIEEEDAETPKEEQLAFPPGLTGEIAKYILESAIRPVREVALMGALSFMAGIAGRQYNIPGSGLNQYLCLLAPTGTGKEGAASGINALINHVAKTVPAVHQFVGPADFASGQALLKTFADKPCFFSIVGEFGLKMQAMADNRATSAEKALHRALLNLYNKSGWHQTENPLVYSDKDKNTDIIQAPSLTVLGESTPETFFSKLNDEHIFSGLLPRFTFLEYKGGRPKRNTTTAFCEPEPALVDSVATLVQCVLTAMNNKQCNDVIFDSQAERMLSQFDTECDQKINDGSEVFKHLWNRGHLKALRLAALIAVGVNHINPVVTAEMAEWAIDFVKKDIGTIEKHFVTSNVNNVDSEAETVARRYIDAYIRMTFDERKHQVKHDKMAQDGTFSYDYIRRKLIRVNPFKSSTYGATTAIRKCLTDLCEAGILYKVPATQCSELYGKASTVYAIGENY